MSIEDKTVLIIDDTSLHRMMLEDLLETIGVKNIYTASNGLEGVRSARYYKPDLVLLDLHMPHVDGFETCEKIRLFANKVMMPIIIITGDDDRKNLDRIFKLGANDYFEKPFNPIDVENRIRFYLEYCAALHKLRQIDDYISQDLITAQNIQKHTMPNVLDIHEKMDEFGLDFYAYTHGDTLGGDAWNILYLECGTPVYLLFDVTGHGINAAINNSFISSLSLSIFEEFKYLKASHFNPALFLEQLNASACQHMQQGTFIAAACMVFDDATNIRYAGCGLPDILMLNKRSGKITNHLCAGLPLGISDKNFTPTSGRIQMSSDHFLLAMTDGLIESLSTKHEDKVKKYGRFLPGERLLNMCLENFSKHEDTKTSSQNVLKLIIDTFVSSSYSLEEDDITLLAFQTKPD